MIVPSFDGQYKFLSNFYPSPITYLGVNYPTVEHGFQAQKAVIAEDMLRIAALRTPGEAKRAGRSIQKRTDWEQVKEKFMYDLLQVKFAHPNLANLLQNTKGLYLVEGNYWHDNYWGDCFCDKCKALPGKNRLGLLLMMVRDGAF